MNETVKKYWPVAVVGVIVFLIYWYYTNNSAGSDSSGGYSTGVSVIPPADNSAQVQAAYGLQQSQIAAGLQAYQSFLGFEIAKDNNATGLEALKVQTQGSLDMQSLLNQHDIGLEQIDTKYQINAIKQTGKNQRKSQAISVLGAVASYALMATAFCYQTTAGEEARYRPYSHGEIAA
jgi:hypothetical protein